MAEEKQPIDTGKKTVTGRTIWRDPKTGEDYSERSTTFQGKDGRYYTMPTVDKNGNQYSEDAIKEYVDKYGAIDYLTGEELPKFKSEKDAIMYAIKRSNTRKQKEESMEQQMELFARGGLEDEGGEIDEVSGNKVPIGGTKKGVRDDIDVKISEGEFVFPEDVTRYIGLEKLMELRQEAKMGLKKMEAMGQMGNSEEATIPDDLPFDMADLIIVSGPAGDTPKEMNRGGVVEAQMGTFVPPNLQTGTVQNTNPNTFTGIAGYQPSVYQQPLGQISAGSQITPASAFKPSDITQTVGTTTGPQQQSTVGGFLPKFVDPKSVQTTVDTPDLDVPEAGDVTKTIKYINPETGEIRDVRTYNNVPTTPLPEGFIPYDEYLNQQETQPVEDTGVQTTQVTRQEDDSSSLRSVLQAKKDEGSNLDNLLKTNNKDDLINLYLENQNAKAVATAAGVINPIFMFGRLAANNQSKRIEERLNEVFEGDSWKENEKIKSFEEKGFLEKTTTGLKSVASGFFEGITNIFDSEAIAEYNENYAAKYDVSKHPFAAGVGTAENLTSQEQQSFDNAVDNGNEAIAGHHAAVARLRGKQNSFIDQGLSRAEGSAMGLSAHDMDQAEKFGGSLQRAIDQGTAERDPTVTSGTQFFTKYVSVDKNTEDTDTNDSTDGGGIFGGYSCYVATALNDKGYWPTIKKIKLIKWCIKTKPENKIDTKIWRNGYVVFGKKIIAPNVDNKIIQWLSNGFYDATVYKKKNIKAILGKLFFYIPSYFIGICKLLTGKLVDIERT